MPSKETIIKRRLEILAVFNGPLTMKQISAKTGYPIGELRASVRYLCEQGYLTNSDSIYGIRSYEHSFKRTSRIYAPYPKKAEKTEKVIETLPPHIRRVSSNDYAWTPVTRRKQNAWIGTSLSSYLP
jgi:predicted transcriptional regulator